MPFHGSLLSSLCHLWFLLTALIQNNCDIGDKTTAGGAQAQNFSTPPSPVVEEQSSYDTVVLNDSGFHFRRSAPNSDFRQSAEESADPNLTRGWSLDESFYEEEPRANEEVQVSSDVDEPREEPDSDFLFRRSDLVRID